MERIEEPLQFERVTRRFAVYVGGAVVSPVYVDKGRLPRPYPPYITVRITCGETDSDL